MVEINTALRMYILKLFFFRGAGNRRGTSRLWTNRNMVHLFALNDIRSYVKMDNNCHTGWISQGGEVIKGITPLLRRLYGGTLGR